MPTAKTAGRVVVVAGVVVVVTASVLDVGGEVELECAAVVTDPSDRPAAAPLQPASTRPRTAAHARVALGRTASLRHRFTSGA
jgi:hypothetical protein